MLGTHLRMWGHQRCSEQRAQKPQQSESSETHTSEGCRSVGKFAGCPTACHFQMPGLQWELLLMRETASRLAWMVATPTHLLGQQVGARLPSKQDLNFRWAPRKPQLLKPKVHAIPIADAQPQVKVSKSCWRLGRRHWVFAHPPLYDDRRLKVRMPQRDFLVFRRAPFLGMTCSTCCSLRADGRESHKAPSKCWADFVRGLSSEGVEAPVKDAMPTSTSFNIPSKDSRDASQPQIAPSGDSRPVFAHPYMPSVTGSKGNYVRF